MRHLFFFAVLLTLLAGCGGNTGYRYTKSGMKYKIIGGSGKDSLHHGDMIKVFFESRFEDSIMGSSNESGYQLFNYDTAMTKQPASPLEIFPMMKVGDSAVCIFKSDSVIKLQFGEKPPPGAVPDWLKPGKHFYMYVKIVQKYSDTASFNADRQKEFEKFKAFQQRMQDKMMADQKQKDSVGFKAATDEFEKYMTGKKEKMIKTAGGAYVEILEPGNGAPCDSGKMVAVRYSGTLLNGTEEFDGNMGKGADTTKKPALDVVIGQTPTIRGFDEGLRQLRGGSRARFYIPAESAYGNSPAGPKIKAYSNLKFDIYIENVTNAPKMPAQPMMPQQQGGAGQHSPNDGHNH